ILLSIHEWTDKDLPEADRERLAELIKLIIDEGDGHWKRLLAVKKYLAQASEEEYLRLTSPPEFSKDPALEQLQRLADAYYDILLQGIKFVFEAEESRGALLEQS